MSALVIFNGRVADISGKQYPSGYRMTIQLITERSYQDNLGQWVNETSSFFMHRWGDYNRDIVQNGKIQKGFGLYVEGEMTRTKNSNGKFFENINIKTCKVTSKPKTYWDAYNQQNQGNPQNQEVPLSDQPDFFAGAPEQNMQSLTNNSPVMGDSFNEAPVTSHSDDDIPF